MNSLVRDMMTTDVMTVEASTAFKEIVARLAARRVSAVPGEGWRGCPRDKPIVLVVTEDREPSDVISAWLREDGLDVIACPGPQAPSYVCAGGRGEPCPLAADADVVVLDLWLASDTMMMGTPVLQLLSYYTGLGKPVVALERPGDPAASFVGDGVELVRCPPDRRSLLRAVRRRMVASGARHVRA